MTRDQITNERYKRASSNDITGIPIPMWRTGGVEKRCFPYELNRQIAEGFSEKRR